MKHKTWYVAFTEGDSDNEYEKFADDFEALSGFLGWTEQEENPDIYEVWACADDECLTPVRCVWSGIGYEL